MRSLLRAEEILSRRDRQLVAVALGHEPKADLVVRGVRITAHDGITRQGHHRATQGERQRNMLGRLPPDNPGSDAAKFRTHAFSVTCRPTQAKDLIACYILAYASETRQAHY